LCCGKGGRRGIYKAAATLGVGARVWKTGAGSAGDRGRSSLRERGIREEEDRADRWGPGAARRGERDAGRWGRGLSGGDERAGGVAGVRDQAVSAAERGERVRAGWAGVREAEAGRGAREWARGEPVGPGERRERGSGPRVRLG